MANFEIASVILKSKEGGYSYDKTDKGNYNNWNLNSPFIGTNHGISAPTLSSYLGRPATINDMKNLSYATALKIYKKDYWDSIGGDNIKNQSIANLLFDGAVNQGVSGIKSVYKNQTNEVLTADSVNNYSNQKQLFEKIQQGRINRYSASDSHYDAWVERVKSYAYQAGQSAVKLQTFAKKNIVPIILISVGGAITLAIILYVIISKTAKK